MDESGVKYYRMETSTGISDRSRHSFMPAWVFCILAGLVSAAGCGQKKTESFTPRDFPSVEVPGIYAEDRDGALEYLAEHFWDDFADTASAFPSDTALVNGVRTGDVEQAFADFSGVLQAVDFHLAEKAVSLMFDRAAACESADTSSNVFETLTGLTERYLYDPNSPLRNEDLYAVYARKMSGYQGISEEKRDVYAYDVRMCSLNSTGTPAADFRFSDASGRIRSLYGIDADYTLLFFSNPGCHACEEIIRVLSEQLSVSSLIASGRLAVVNVYIDEDLTAWYDYMSIYPEDWYNGYDPDGVIRSDVLYNVRAIPSLYILDRDKTVIMKDAPDQRVFSFLASIADEG